MKISTVVISILLAASLCQICNGSERDVFLYIFDKYDNRIRPVQNSTTTTYVGVQFQIISLLEVNQHQEYIAMAVFFKLNWTDEYLTWNPADFDGTDYIRAHKYQVWHPDFAIVTTSLQAQDIVAQEEELVGIHYTGQVFFSFPIVLTNYCPMTTARFPFDSQSCIVKGSSWGYTSQFITMQNVFMANTSARNPNTEWDIMPTTNEIINFTREGANEDGVYSQILYYVTLKRKPTYYVWVIMVPTFIISALSIAGIFAPFSSTGEREEKVTLGLTTLLTLAVILSLVTGDLPKTTSLSVLGIFILLELIICTLSVSIAVVISYFHQRATTRLWPFPKWLMFCCATEKTIEHESVVENVDITKKTSKKVAFEHFENTLDAIRRWLAKSDEEENLKIQWIIFFDQIDVICFVIFQIINFLIFVISFAI